MFEVFRVTALGVRGRSFYEPCRLPCDVGAGREDGCPVVRGQGGKMAALWCGVEWDTALRRDAPFCKGCEGVWCCDYFSHWRREPAVGLEAQEKGPFGGSLHGSGPL